MSPYKAAFKSTSLGTQAPALVRVLLRGRTLDCTRSPRGTRRSPAAWGPVRTRPAPPSGSEALNLRQEENAVTAALRKEEKPLREGTQMHSQTCYPLLLKETRDRQTHRPHCISLSARRNSALCEVKPKTSPDTCFLGKPPLPLCCPRLKFALHGLLNWII